MTKTISTATLAAALAGALLSFSQPASAQVGIELGVGPGGPRVRTYDDSYRPVIERRNRRVIVDEDDGEDCRIVVRRRTNEFGETVTRRTRVCD